MNKVSGQTWFDILVKVPYCQGNIRRCLVVTCQSHAQTLRELVLKV